jgi:hypothetical protein
VADRQKVDFIDSDFDRPNREVAVSIQPLFYDFFAE